MIAATSYCKKVSFSSFRGGSSCGGREDRRAIGFALCSLLSIFYSQLEEGLAQQSIHCTCVARAMVGSHRAKRVSFFSPSRFSISKSIWSLLRNALSRAHHIRHVTLETNHPGSPFIDDVSIHLRHSVVVVAIVQHFDESNY